MTFHLYIMRHAKSDWSGSGISDIDRPINQRGQKNAKQIGQWMQDHEYIPQGIISSPALRARQTIELVTDQLHDIDSKNIIYEKDLYLANIAALLDCIRKYKQNLNSLMLVAHNPGLEQLVHYLANKTTEVVKNKTMTTANLVIFEYTDNKCDIETDEGKLKVFIKPKELGLKNRD